MKKGIIFGLIAAGVATAAAVIYKSKKNNYYCDNDNFDKEFDDYDDCGDCCCGCDDGDCCDEDCNCEIPAEKAESAEFVGDACACDCECDCDYTEDEDFKAE